MCTYIYIYIYVTHMCTHVPYNYIYILLYTSVCIHTCIYIYIYTSVDLCIYIHTALRIRSSRGLAAMLSIRQLYLRTCHRTSMLNLSQELESQELGNLSMEACPHPCYYMVPVAYSSLLIACDTALM